MKSEALEAGLVQPVFDYRPRTRVVYGEGALARVGELAHELGFLRTLIVADHGIVAAGHVEPSAAALRAAGISVSTFSDFGENPDTRMIEAGRTYAESCGIDSILAIGGGSSLDTAKGINFLFTNGGTMRDYRGYGKASQPMLPSIGVPTTTGTGSEAQSYALVTDPVSHTKMACGDPKVAFRVAILDPRVTTSQPRSVAVAAGYDAIAHAVESYVSTARSGMSDLFAGHAWHLLDGHYEQLLSDQDGDVAVRGAMLLGAHYAGAAIEQSMLGATHACANAVSARCGTTHGLAIGLFLHHVVSWNAPVVEARYAALLRAVGRTPGSSAGKQLAAHLAELARVAGIPATLRELGVSHDELNGLAAHAATQWTGTFNPRPFDREAARQLFEQAF